MKYSELAEIYQTLEKVTGKLKMTEIVAELFKKASSQDLPLLATLIRGSPFPARSPKELEMGNSLVKSAISVATGATEDEIDQKWKETGDLGSTVKYFLEHRKQVVLARKEITVRLVRDNLVKIAEESGPGSQDRKIKLLAELITSATPLEAKYIVRTVLGELRVGVGEGIVRDAISQAFNVDSELVENVYFVLGDFGRIAQIAREKGERGLKKLKPEIGVPIKSMEAIKEPDLKTALEDAGKPCMIEEKYDGYKIQIHKDGDKIILFTRRLEEVTNAFPDVVQFVRDCIKANKCIIEGECIAVDPKTGRQRPFQYLSRRIKRKYKIQEIIKKIPVELKLFDALLIEDENLMNKPLKERRRKLEKIIEEKPGKITLSGKLITSDLDEAMNFYQSTVEKGYEGVMIKNLEAKYQPGRREGYQYKVKPTLEPLDVVVTRSIWGEGKRAKWLSSYYLAVRDPDTGELLEIGKMATGLTEEQLDQMTKKLKPLIVSEKGKEVKVRPKIVIEVEYEEIQKSPTYKSGYALRFPRLRRFRLDKDVNEIDDIKRVERLFKTQ